MRYHTPSLSYPFLQIKTSFIAFAMFFLVFGLLFNISFAHAQTPSGPGPSPEEVLQEATGIEEMVLVADVSIAEANLLSQEGNNFRISFTISNGKLVQPSVKYSIQLVRPNDDGSFSIIDEKVYPSALSMGENSKVTKEIVYTAPSYLSGTYNLRLYSENGTGLILAFYDDIGEVTLSGDGKFIKLSDCYLKVAGDKSDKKYRLYAGVDIMPNEKLVGYCSASNGFSKEITTSPSFTTYLRSRFGEVLKEGVLGDKSITINTSKNSQISFTIPTADKPQAYDAKMTLVDENGVTISNSVIFHYVLRGESATIQNARLNKASYKKGDDINISFFWTGSADNFLDSRYNTSGESSASLSLTIIDSFDGQICAPTIQRDIQSQNSFVDISTVATKDCVYPAISVEISSPDGTVLAQRDFDFKEAAITERASSVEEGGIGVSDIVAIIVIVILLIGALIIFRRFSGPTGGALAVVALIFIGGAFVAPQSASAATACWGGGFICAATNYRGGTYKPDQPIGNIKVITYGGRCGNYYYKVDGYFKLTGGWNSMGSVSNVSVNNSKYLYTGNLNAPASIGGYNLHFKFKSWQNCFNTQGGDDCTINKSIPWFGFSVPITVVNSPPPPSVTNSTSPPSVNTGTINSSPQCSDGIDNDGDGWIDFPEDLGCISASSNNESNTPNDPPQCSDGIDNDADTAIDGNDNGCSSARDNNESIDPDFSLQKSRDINITIISENAEVTGQTNIMVSANDSFTDDVTFSTANLQIGAGLPTDLSRYSFTDPTLDNSEYTTGTPFTVTIPNTITSGTYVVTVHAIGAGLNRDINVFITVTNVNPFFKEI